MCDNDNKENKGTKLEKYTGTIKGLLSVFTVSCLLVLSSTFVQLLDRRIPDFELNALRSMAGLVLTLLTAFYTRELPVVPISEILSTLCFGLFSFTGVSFYVAITFIPLSTAESILLTSAIVFSSVLFAIFGQELITLANLTSAIVCITGVLLIVQPESIFHQTEHLPEDMVENTKNVILGYCFSILAAIPLPSNVLLVKKHVYLKENISKVLLWTYFMGTVLSVLISFIYEKYALPHNYYDALFIVGHCCCYIFVWPLATYSSLYVSGNIFSIGMSSCVVFMLIPQYSVLSNIQPGKRNWKEVTGIILVLIGNILASVKEIIHKYLYELKYQTSTPIKFYEYFNVAN